ncbi:MAG: hypothetical protein H0X63_07875 [Flavobacteriales bacterium]|nr:hypothetical protein [Flavobacteriales bacterium]
MKTTLKLEELALFLFGIFLFAQSPFDKLRVRWRGLKKFTLRQAQGSGIKKIKSPFDRLRVRWRGLNKFTLRQAQGSEVVTELVESGH